MNIPARGPLAPLRDVFEPPPGYEWVKADAKNLEVRIALYDNGLDPNKVISLDPFTELVTLGKGVFEEVAEKLNTDPKAIKKVKGRDIAKMVAHCLTADTEVRTKHRGWQKICDVNITEEILIWDHQARTSRFEKPLKKWEYQYEGYTYKLKGASIDLECTPNHKFLFGDRRNTKDSYAYDVESAFDKSYGCNYLDANPGTKKERVSDIKVIKEWKKIPVFCFQTSTSFFFVRRNGKSLVSHNSATNGVGLDTINRKNLDTKRMKTLEEKGAIRVFYDWELGDEIVYATGIKVAQTIFGTASDENRKKALELQYDIYYKLINLLDWHKKVSKEVFDLGYVRSLCGSILWLDSPETKENFKAAFSVKTQGGGAYFMRSKMIEDWERYGRLWTLMVHDEMDTVVPTGMSDLEIYESFKFLEEESKTLPGLKIPFEMKRGTSWMNTRELTLPK